jgi:hypothetical protein
MPDIMVLVVDPDTGALRPGLPRPPKSVSGIDKLVQLVALLSNGGRSIANPGRAGGLRQLLGLNIDPDDPSEIFADVRLMVSRVEQFIKEEQVLTNRPPSERLLLLQLVDVIAREEDLSIEIIVGVINEQQAQQRAVVAVL